MFSADDVAEVILARSGPWTDAMRLQKLLYYVQAWHLAVTDEPLFPEKFKAFKDGPVVPQVWHLRKDRATRSAAAQDPEKIVLDELTSNLIDLVIASYGSMSGEELSALTHVEQPWLEARGNLPSDAPSNAPLRVDSMAKFYRASRRLGGRTASDLAAGGVYLREATAGPIDVDAIFEAVEGLPDSVNDSDWGSTNVPADARWLTDIASEPVARAYAT
jgi:uncharacterized phage-associated protein